MEVFQFEIEGATNGQSMAISESAVLVETLTETELGLKFNFENPNLISMSDQNANDRLRMKINPEMIKGGNGL